MNSKQHALSSVQIFGGEVKDYLPIHEFIDSSKIVTDSILGRFFLHHYDLGGSILESVFGKETTITGHRTVKTKDILLQHLIEDYDQVPTFEDWMKAFPDLEEHNFPTNSPLGMSAFKSPILDLPDSVEIFVGPSYDELDDDIKKIVSLKSFKVSKQVSQNFWRLSIFGHKTGLWLLKKVAQSETTDLDINLTESLNIALGFDPKEQNALPHFHQWTDHITPYQWMFAPKTKDRFNSDLVKEKIKKYNSSDLKTGIKGNWKVVEMDTAPKKVEKMVVQPVREKVVHHHHKSIRDIRFD